MCLVFCGPSEKRVVPSGRLVVTHWTFLLFAYDSEAKLSFYLCFEAVTLPDRSASFSWITGRQCLLPGF